MKTENSYKIYYAPDGSSFSLNYHGGKIYIGTRSKTKLTRTRRKAIARALRLRLSDCPNHLWPRKMIVKNELPMSLLLKYFEVL